MKTLRFFISVNLILFLLSAQPLRAQWQKTNGPASNMVMDMVEHKGELFAGTQGGIYKSQDGGMTWTFASSSIPHRGLYHLLSTAQVLVSGSDNGIYISTNSGASWTQPITGMSDINDLAQNANTLFAATDQDGIKISHDNGQTWSFVNSPVVGSLINFIETHNGIVFADGNNSILKSTDNGATWTALPLSGIGLPNQSSVAAFVSTGGKLYAGVQGSGLYVSVDNGNTFTAINSGFPVLGWNSVRTVLDNGQVLLAGFMGQAKPVYASSNGGQSWTLSSNGMRFGDGATGFFLHGNRIFASTARGLYASDDNGLNWVLTDKGITNGFVDAIASNNTYLFAGTANRGTGGAHGIYRSSDQGQTWQAIDNGISHPLSVKAMMATNTVVLAGGNNRTLYRSTDNGNTWTNVGLTANIGSDVTGFATIGNTFFLISEFDGVFKSTDQGLTWSNVTSGTTVNTLGYAIGSDGSSLFVAAGSGSYQSDDGGQTWNNTGMISVSTWGTAFHSYGNYVFMGTRNQGMYRRLKTANTWTAVNSGLPQPAWITSITGKGDSLFAATDYSSSSYVGMVYLSTDSGASWSPFNQGLPQNIAVRCLLVHDGKLMAGTGSLYHNDGRSVWYYGLELSTGDEEMADRENSLRVFPNPSRGAFTIFNTTGLEEVLVADMTGKVIFRKTVHHREQEMRVDLEQIQPGVYLLQTRTGGKVETRRLVIQ